MLAIEVELLGGRYVATAHNDRELAEWPPHPARFFSALVAALHDLDPEDPAEREALLWLETQAPPALDVDLEVSEMLGRRDVLDVYVPVNDVSVLSPGVRQKIRDTAVALDDCRSAIAALEAAPRTKATERELKAARASLARDQTKLAAMTATHTAVDSDPSKEVVKTAASLLPDQRTRKLRTFPVVVPTRPTFALIWKGDAPSTHREALDRLCMRVTRLGHSSSLVRCGVVDRDVAPTLVPDVQGDLTLRVVGPGQVARLEREFERHQAEESRVLPARPQRYGRPPLPVRATVRESVFSDDWILFERIGAPRPLGSRGADVARALRRALLEVNGDKGLPSALSGHRPDGSPAETPHVAFVPCPFVGHEHADGSVQGIALVLPRTLLDQDRDTLLRLIAKWEQTRARADGTLELGVTEGPRLAVQVLRVEVTTKDSLRPEHWCRVSRSFVTATPIVLDRYPGNLRSNLDRTAHKATVEAQRSIADSCERIGLPRPMSVEVSIAPLIPGAQPVHAFSPWPRQARRAPRARVHAHIVFAEWVRGPVLLGAGRFFGLGLCLPLPEPARPER